MSPAPVHAVDLAGIALAMAARLRGIVDELKAAVGARAGRDRSVAPLVMLLWNRLSRLVRLFDAVAARVAAGIAAPPPRVRVRQARPAGPEAPRLPRGHAWLIRRMIEAATAASRVRYLLADPDMAALLAAEPATMRLLRPLCRMLDVDLPGPPPRPRETAVAADAAPPTAPAGKGGMAHGPAGRSGMAVDAAVAGTPFRPPRDG